VDREQDYLESLEAEVQDLTEGKTPRELAELLIQSRDHASSLQASLDIKMNQLNQATMRIAGLANQVTAMDNIRERMTAEVRERDFTIQGQAEDMVEYEKAMDVLRERVEDLEAFKARVGGALGGLHLVMHELTSSLPGGPSDELDAG
jgi:chromosome segregation ATPase